MLFVVTDENKETLLGCNDVTIPKRWIAHRSVGCFCFFLIGRIGILFARPRGRHEFLRPAARILYPLLPLFAREVGIRKFFHLLGETANRSGRQEEDCRQGCDSKLHGMDFKAD